MIPVLPGDGIGPIVTRQAVRVLHTLGHQTREFPFGHQCWLDSGEALPEATLAAVRSAKVALVGAATSPADGCPSPILQLRRALGLDLLVRPTAHCTVVGHAFEGLYAEPEQSSETAKQVVLRRVLTAAGIDRLVAEAFARARTRVTLVDKPTVFRASATLFRASATRHQRPGIDWEAVNADAFVAAFVRDRAGWDVIAGTSFISDVLSDLTAAFDQGVGGAPSASLGPGCAVFEPVHGSAPRRVLERPDAVDPTGAMLAVGLLLDHCGETDQATALRHAVAGARRLGLDRTSRIGDTVVAEREAWRAGSLPPPPFR